VTANATKVFWPNEVYAVLGDTVWFNCACRAHLVVCPRLFSRSFLVTNGTHSATQSTFAQPCTPAHDSNITINGFDSQLRPAGNGTAVTNLPVPITPEIANTTLWFYDRTTCGGGGVGVINANESSSQTLAGFQRNAIRLNGTGATSSAHPSPTSGSGGGSGSGSSSSSSSTNKSNGAAAMTIGALAAAPLVLIGLAL
jgi:hypothetical protein